MKSIIIKAKKLFQDRINKSKGDPHNVLSVNKFGDDPFGLLRHVPEVEKWALYLCEKHPSADRETVLLGVWLHDIGHYPVSASIDHARRSAEIAKKFFQREKYPKDKMEKALHVIRAHRCKDVLPETLEARIVACADSASHLTDFMYMDIACVDKAKKQAFRAYGKMARDYRDLAAFPEVKKALTPLHRAWENVIKEYEKIDL